MVAADVAELNNSLLKTVVSYAPIYGSRIDVSQAMEQAFRKYPRHEFVEHFDSVRGDGVISGAI
ncbi:hypothetical protein QN224_32415 [Sinorhizobium sp. 8-89]|uniref:hypothetical protein n=1 Tax=Sinorhizobium sp. 7-81 TaxID=3049087 RepID=UPI0024C2F2F3|nr:hypothetical protein [Sinorhizobium sp. 7-81]MDK1390023.1 hypothetical protein [Sinorhizobium sp. 7-81]